MYNKQNILVNKNSNLPKLHQSTRNIMTWKEYNFIIKYVVTKNADFIHLLRRKLTSIYCVLKHT